MHLLHEWPSLEARFVTALGVFFEVVALLLVPLVLVRRKEPSSTIAWILTLVFMPPLGALLFLLFGRDRVRAPARRKRELDALVRAEVAARTAGPSSEQERAALAAMPQTDLELALFRIGAMLTHARPTGANSVQLLLGGGPAYAALGAAIDAAKHHVHAEYYLIRNDETGRWFRDRLAAAAARGVEVRMLCDGFGCFTLPRRWAHPLRSAGARVDYFLPLRAMLLQPMNLRNHRKIVVVDGTVAFTGGINIGDEYKGHMRGLGEWRDVHLQVDGAAAGDLQRVFVQDWTFATGEALDLPRYFPETDRGRPPTEEARVAVERHEGQGHATIAIVPSGPDTRTEAIHRLFFGAISGARERVYITTPYFVPDEALLIAMELAAMRGVDVRIVLPHLSNHAVTFHAGRSFYEPLLEAGVKVYEYRPGIVHAKTMVVDGVVSLVGSANMDLRSFRLNFEVHTLIHDAAAARGLEEAFFAALKESDLIDLKVWRARGLGLRLKEGASRLVSPLL